jgi:hypothetical protein
MASQSTVATHLSEDELFQRWTDRWDHFLDDFSATSSSSTISELLRNKVKSGNAELAALGEKVDADDLEQAVEEARKETSEQGRCTGLTREDPRYESVGLRDTVNQRADR